VVVLVVVVLVVMVLAMEELVFKYRLPVILITTTIGQVAVVPVLGLVPKPVMVVKVVEEVDQLMVVLL
jgi:hypothetical protein